MNKKYAKQHTQNAQARFGQIISVLSHFACSLYHTHYLARPLLVPTLEEVAPPFLFSKCNQEYLIIEHNSL